MAECVRCRSDNPADARFCMSCGIALGLGCDRCGRSLPADAAFCAFCGTRVSAGQGDSAETIKLVTVLFADVVGSTAQAERMHPEDTRALMAEFFDAMSDEIRAEGGTVERIIGDAIMADFGVPLAREDDPVRAVRAARRMLDRLEKFNAERDEWSRIQIRIGINTGAVSTGGSFGEQLLVMGDAVNVAARLEQAAAPGTIVIGERTARAVRDHFRLRELESLQAKGKTDAVPAFRVEEELDLPDDQAGIMTIPLVGRAGEMKKLQDVFSSVSLERAAHLITVIGDPGVGKSRLTREFLEWVEGRARILFGRCLPYGDGITFWPLREILRSEIGLSAADSSAQAREKVIRFAEEIADPNDPAARDVLLQACYATIGLQQPAGATALDPRETFRHLLDGWRLLLSHHATSEPLVVVIEDLQWADNTLLDVLDHLVRHVDGPVMFICPARPDLVDIDPRWIAGLRNYSSIHLDPLGDEESCRFMSLLLELDELPEAFTQKILDRAEGNPFFLEEILNRLIDEGHFVLREGRWEPTRDISDVEIPDNVQAAILARLDLLSSKDRSVVQLAGVIGRTFWEPLLQELTGEAELSQSLETLTRRNVIVERGRSGPAGEREFAFKHVLTRDVAYSTLPRRNRGEAHAAVARWIESTRGRRAAEIAELVAHHFDQAYECLGDDELRQKARAYLVVASRNAALRFATQQAETLGRRAVELSQDGERTDALEMLADVFSLSGRGDDAWRTYVEALEELQGASERDGAMISRICASAAMLPTRNWGSIDVPPPDHQIQRVLDLGFAIPQHTGSARDRCLLFVAKAFFDADHGRAKAARDAADHALEVAEGLNHPDLISVALDALAGTYMHPEGHYGDVARITQRRLSLVPRLSDRAEISDVQGMAAVSAVLIGRYPEAVQRATESAESSRGLDVGSYIHALNWRAQAHFMAGDWDSALRDEAEIAQIERRSADDPPGPYSARAYAAACLCLILRSSHEAGARIQVMRRFKEESEWFKNVSALPARGLARRGHPSEAWAWLDLSRWVYRAQHLEAACDLVAIGEDWQRAEEILVEARDEGESCGLVALLFFADRLEGQLGLARGDVEGAYRALDRSASGFTSVGAPWEAAWSELLGAEALARAGRGAEGRSLCEQAARTFRRLGSVSEMARAESLQKELQEA